MFQSPSGGGGFMRGGGMGDSTPGAGYGGGDTRRCCLPVTLKQVENAEEEGDSAFLIDRKNVNMITFVARIRSVNEQSTNIKYKLEDGTGTVEVTLWLDQNDTDEAAQKRALLQEGTYVRVVGNMRTFMQKRSVVAFHIAPVTDFNEITNHMLSALHAHLRSAVMPMGSQGAFNPNIAPATGTYGGGYGNNPQQHGGMAGAPQQQYGHQSYQQGHMAGGGMNNYNGGGGHDDFQKPVQRDVLAVVKSVGGSSDVGVSFGDIIQRLRKYPESEIRGALDFLSGEGHIYSTIDDDHYKSTEED